MGTVLAANDQALLTSHRARGLDPSEISAHGYCHVVLKTTPVPIYGHDLLRPHHGHGLFVL